MFIVFISTIVTGLWLDLRLIGSSLTKNNWTNSNFVILMIIQKSERNENEK